MAKAREKKDVNLAKARLGKIIQGDVANVDEMKTKLEAILYRLSNPSAAADDGEAGDGTSNSSASHPNRQTPIEPSALTIKFDEALGKERVGKKIVRYQVNPRPDWGPMNKASG